MQNEGKLTHLEKTLAMASSEQMTETDHLPPTPYTYHHTQIPKLILKDLHKEQIIFLLFTVNICIELKDLDVFEEGLMLL